MEEMGKEKRKNGCSQDGYGREGSRDHSLWGAAHPGATPQQGAGVQERERESRPFKKKKKRTCREPSPRVQ